jgi:hypothetical protein
MECQTFLVVTGAILLSCEDTMSMLATVLTAKGILIDGNVSLGLPASLFGE